jgi:hypothetical protein
MGIPTTRDDDARVLRILKLRIAYGAAKTARHTGMKPERVRTICNRILNEDIRESVKDGIETPEQVMSGYWSDLNG